MKEKILELLGKKHYRQSDLEEILDANLTEVLYEMINDHQIKESKKGTLSIVDYKTCELKLDNKKLCVYIDNQKYLIEKKNIGGIMPGDIVGVDIDTDRRTAEIIKVVNHKKTVLIGEVVLYKGALYISNRNKLTKINDSYPIGTIVSYKNTESIDYKFSKGKVLEVIGHKDEPDTYLLALAKKYDIDNDFSDEAKRQVEKLPSQVYNDELVNRVDLRDEMVYTIDGDTSKDFDDAISITRRSNGNYILKVHIADVAHYVKKDSPIDMCARNKTTSSYPLDKVFPMLPFELSDGICSLNPLQDRLTRTHEMEIDSTGNLISYKTYRSVINSKIRMTYKKVNDVLNGNTPLEYEEFKDNLLLANSLAHTLRSKRLKNGALDLDIKESYIEMSNDEVEDVKYRERSDAEKLIEEFMLLTGFSTAHYLTKLGVPVPYRVHEEMTAKGFFELKDTLRKMGLSSSKLPKDNSNKSISNLIASIKNDPNREIYYIVILRSLTKACYSINNKGHYALNEPYDVQITSPIRRYLDLCTERILDDIEDKKEIDKDNLENFLDETCKLASTKEVNSDFFERDLDEIKKCEYMEKHIDEVYKAKIVGNSKNGVSVKFYNGINGVLDCNGYQFNDYDYTFKTKYKLYRLGDTLDIIVDHVDKTNCLVRVKVLTK